MNVSTCIPWVVVPSITVREHTLVCTNRAVPVPRSCNLSTPSVFSQWTKWSQLSFCTSCYWGYSFLQIEGLFSGLWKKLAQMSFSTGCYRGTHFVNLKAFFPAFEKIGTNVVFYGLLPGYSFLRFEGLFSGSGKNRDKCCFLRAVTGVLISSIWRPFLCQKKKDK